MINVQAAVIKMSTPELSLWAEAGLQAALEHFNQDISHLKPMQVDEVAQNTETNWMAQTLPKYIILGTTKHFEVSHLYWMALSMVANFAGMGHTLHSDAPSLGHTQEFYFLTECMAKGCTDLQIARGDVRDLLSKSMWVFTK